MMYGRFVGHYSLQHLYKYLFYDKGDHHALLQLLPTRKNYSFYSQGRHALYSILKQLKEQQGIRTVGVPVWSCAIIHKVIEELGLERIPLDVDSDTLKLSSYYFEKIATKKKIDCVLLVCENGHLYTQSEIDYFKSKGVITILDYCLAMRSVNGIKQLQSDFEIYSGGYSKPVSGFELGIAASDQYHLEVLPFTNDISLAAILKVLIHLLLERPMIYGFIKAFLPKDKSDVYRKSELKGASYRSISALKYSLTEYLKWKPSYIEFQRQLHSTLRQKGIPSSYDECVHSVISKVLINKNVAIPFADLHRQYKPQWKEIKQNAEFVGANRIVNELHSLAINHTVIDDQNEFLEKLSTALSPTH